jgi:FkbH-like protein
MNNSFNKFKSEDFIYKNNALASPLLKAEGKLVELTKAVEGLEDGCAYSRIIRIGISAAVTVSLLNIYLRKYGLLNDAKIEIVNGNYDDPIGDIDLFIQANVEQIVLLPFFDNLQPSFEAQLENIDPALIDAKIAETLQRYRVVFDKANSIKTIYLGTYHRMGAAADPGGCDFTSLVLARFNETLRTEAANYSNVLLIDTEDIVQSVSKQFAFDPRFYYRNKAPYSGTYMNELAHRIASASRGFGSHFYKVLVLDCDNTLWGGVIGEDLINGIKLGPYEYPGNIFWRLQHEFAALERQGILLALVTKNNLADIEEVFKNHPNMVLTESQIVAKKVNWKDKPSNLRDLAKELNLGLDSFVFLDDSSFECESVRRQLPMVKTVQVPATITDYPRVVADIKSLFLAGGITSDSKEKTEQYRQRANAEELKAQFKTQEEYLASLELKVFLTRNALASTGRISELSQKSNQFNLTTKRYTVTEIEQMMTGDMHGVYSLEVSDKFGNAGLTGVAVILYEEGRAIVENFFMSCRVIGRGVETVIWSRIVDDAIHRGCTELRATYQPSAKNSQVVDFYDRLGIPLANESEGTRHYAISIVDFNTPTNPWIKMNYA